MTIDDITIDPEFKAFLPPLSSDAYTALQVEILRDGCNDPLTVWEEEGVLIDGHHRLDICNANDVECDCSTVSLPNRDEAKRWTLHHARARRNSTPDELSYMRGLEYNLEKRQDGGHGDQKSGGKSCTPIASEKLADAHGVSERTIKNDGKYAEAVDTIAKNVGPEAKRTLLSGDELSYMRGVEYNLEKKEPHRPKADKKGGQTCPLKTAQKLADAHGVSEPTIENDGNGQT